LSFPLFVGAVVVGGVFVWFLEAFFYSRSWPKPSIRQKSLHPFLCRGLEPQIRIGVFFQQQQTPKLGEKETGKKAFT
jgi:hypothetical protein